MFEDVRYALRVMRKNPGFTSVAVLSLAIGIGANSAIYSLADALLLRPLPVLRPGEVVTVRAKTPNDPFGAVSYLDYVDYRNRNRTFDGLTAFSLYPLGFSSSADAVPQLKYGLIVTGNFFQVLGVQPVPGRAFRPDEDQVPGRDAVVVLSHEFWQKEFGGERSAIGRTVRLNGIEFTVVGVAPEHFTGVDQYFRPAMYVPIAMSPRLSGTPTNNTLDRREYRALTVKGRLKSGVSNPQAEADLVTIAKGLEQTYPKTNQNQSIAVRTELQARVERSPPDAMLVAMMMVLVALVLLVACANVANLFLSRARARSREIAVRLAIGAGRRRLVRQLLTESLLVALAGGLAGLIVAQAGIAFLSRIQVPTDLPIVLSIELSRRVLLFSLAASVLSALLFGLTPAIQSVRTDLVPALKSADADRVGKRRLWGRSSLVVIQVALSLVLLVSASTMLRGFRRMLLAGPGFRTDHLVMMSFDPTLVRYTQAQADQFYQQLEDRTRTLPGVKSAALTYVIPMAPNQDVANIVPEGHQFPKGTESATVFADSCDEHYFDTLGIPIRRGRGFRETDTAKAPLVAVINEKLASHYWPGQDPIGKRFRLNDRNGSWVEIVGLAKTTKYLWIAEPPTDFVYFPVKQRPRPRMTLVAESLADPGSLVAALREVVRGLDSSQPIYDVRTMADFYDKRAVSVPGLIIQTVGTMGLMGLTLAMVGLYGLVAYSVAARTREIGIRMAIGAGSGLVLRMVLRQGLTLAFIGIAVGLLLSYAAVRLIASIFNGSGTDVMTLVLVPIGLLAVTLLATSVPARRAAKIDPMRALRYE